MSQTALARTGPLHAPVRPTAPVPATPALRVVPVLEPHRSRIGLVVACLTLLVGGLVTLLMLNISLGHGSYEMYQLQSRQDALAEQQQALEEDLIARSAPQTLARRAAGLGMVPAQGSTFLQLSPTPSRGVAERTPRAPIPPVRH